MKTTVRNLKRVIKESVASEALEDAVAKAINDSGSNIHASKAGDVKLSDVYVEVDGVSTYVEVKMNHTDNLLNTRFFFDGNIWNASENARNAPATKFALDLINKSSDAKDFVKDLKKFMGVKRVKIPTNKGGLKDPEAPSLEDMTAFIHERGNGYFVHEPNVNLGSVVTKHYTFGKASPAHYIQSKDDFYIIGKADPLGLKDANKDIGKIPTLGGSGPFRVRVSLRSEYYEIQPEVKMKFHPASSPFSVLPGSSKPNPFHAISDDYEIVDADEEEEKEVY